MSGILPPPIFVTPSPPEHTRQAEQRFCESSDHGFAIGLAATVAVMGNLLARTRIEAAAIDKARTAAFKIGLRSTEPAPNDRADPCCRC